MNDCRRISRRVVLTGTALGLGAAVAAAAVSQAAAQQKISQADAKYQARRRTTSTATAASFSADEKHAWDQLDISTSTAWPTPKMAIRPQTLYGFADSPVGLAAWMLDHDIRSYGMISRVFDGKTEGLTRDDVLDNVTLYWLTNTGISWRASTGTPRRFRRAGGFFDAGASRSRLP